MNKNRLLKQLVTYNLKNGIANKRAAKLINILLGLITIVCFICTLFLSIFFNIISKTMVQTEFL